MPLGPPVTVETADIDIENDGTDRSRFRTKVKVVYELRE